MLLLLLSLLNTGDLSTAVELYEFFIHQPLLRCTAHCRMNTDRKKLPIYQ